MADREQERVEDTRMHMEAAGDHMHCMHASDRPVDDRSVRSLERDCRLYSGTGKLAGKSIGPTRAAIDNRRRKLRSSISTKQQQLNALTKKMDDMHVGIDVLLTELQTKLLEHPSHAKHLVQCYSDEFNHRSIQLKDMYKQYALLKNELILLKRMVDTRSESMNQSLPLPMKTTCKISAHAESSSVQGVQTVCGFPVSENMYDQLTVEESQSVVMDRVEPAEICESEIEEIQKLINPRLSRVKRDDHQKISVNQLSTQAVQIEGKSVSNMQNVNSVQDQSISVQKTAVPDQQTSVKTNQSENGGNPSQPRESAGTPSIVSLIQWQPKTPPTYHGNVKEDVSKWTGYMTDFLTFMQGTAEQQVRFAATYLRENAGIWWRNYVKKNGYPRCWTELSKALNARFGDPNRARKARAKLMGIQQGQRKIQEYIAEFEALLYKLPSYDESWMLDIFIWGLQPHMARIVTAHRPQTVDEATTIAKEIDFAIRASQPDCRTGKTFNSHKQSKGQKQKSEGTKFLKNLEGRRQEGEGLRKRIQAGVAENRSPSTYSDSRPDDVQYITVQLNSLSSDFELNKARETEGASRNPAKNPATIWREGCTTLSRRARAELVEKRGPILVCNLVALTRANGQRGAGNSRVTNDGDRQQEPSPTSRHQSNRLLRREHERLMRDRVREQRQVERLLAAVVSPSSGGTQPGTTATPRTFQTLSETVVEDSSPGMKKTEAESEKKPQRHWTSIASVKTTDVQATGSCSGPAAGSCKRIDRTPRDGVLLIVPVVIAGKIFKALVDSGATRCFVSPSCVAVTGLQGKRLDTFLELGDGQRVLSRNYVPEVPVTLAGHTSKVALTVTTLPHCADVVLGMTWLQLVRPVIDWVSGELYIPNSVSTSLIQGEWLQAAVKAGTVTILSSHEKLKELQNERIREGLSIITTPHFWQSRKAANDRLWTISPSGGSSYCTLLKDMKNDDCSQMSDENADKLFVKRLCNNAALPRRGTEGAAGYDLSAAHESIIPAKGKGIVKTGLAISFPPGMYARIAPRSGLAIKKFIDVGAGVVDQDYRGEVGVILFNHSDSDFQVKQGDRIAQLILEKIETPAVQEVQELGDTERGSGGFGSTEIQSSSQQRQ